MSIFVDMFYNFLVFLIGATNDFGLAIIAFTFLIRTALLPLTLPSLRSGIKMRELQPELKKIQKKHKGDLKAMQAAQSELYKKYNINPLAGCLPQLAQLVVLVILYNVLNNFLHNPVVNGSQIATNFLWFDLAHPDKTYILPILTVVTQFILSMMIAPGAEVKDEVPNDAKSDKGKKENEKEEDFAEMAQSMQQQMLFILPLTTGYIAINFPSGLALYWVVTTIFSIGQQYYISGLGGITIYSKRAYDFVSAKLQRK